MKNKAHNLSTYTFSASEGVLIDANIWLLLFPAPCNPNDPKDKRPQRYSAGFAKLMSAKAVPFLDSMVLSEYLNRYARLEWEGSYKTQYPKFKDFRKSVDFKSVASSAHVSATKMLSFCQVHEIAVNKLALKEAVDSFQSGNCDFNDAILLDVCKKSQLKLLTDDGDFQSGGIDVITSNQTLLRACTKI